MFLGRKMNSVYGFDMWCTEVGNVGAPGRRGVANEGASREREKQVLVPEWV